MDLIVYIILGATLIVHIGLMFAKLLSPFIVIFVVWNAKRIWRALNVLFDNRLDSCADTFMDRESNYRRDNPYHNNSLTRGAAKDYRKMDR
jgi:hypothetical protein